MKYPPLPFLNTYVIMVFSLSPFAISKIVFSKCYNFAKGGIPRFLFRNYMDLCVYSILINRIPVPMTKKAQFL